MKFGGCDYLHAQADKNAKVPLYALNCSEKPWSKTKNAEKLGVRSKCKGTREIRTQNTGPYLVS